MTHSQSDSLLGRALAVSHEVLAAVEQVNLQAATALDGERLRLLQSARAKRESLSAEDRAVLALIAELNDRALGLMEHHRRRKERAMDMIAVGKRAVRAYSGTRL
jgi:hypothetical protein